jgi:predicted nucleotidyltransferase
MNSNRLFEIVLLDLTTDKLKMEDRLERVINSDFDIDEKVSKIKTLVSEINNIDLSITKFQSMISIENNNNENKN